MYWSNYGIHEYRELLTEVGFSLLQVTTTGHGYEEGTQPPELPRWFWPARTDEPTTP